MVIIKIQTVKVFKSINYLGLFLKHFLVYKRSK